MNRNLPAQGNQTHRIFMQKRTTWMRVTIPLAALAALSAQAQYNPLPLSEGSFNYDIVVEKTAQHPFTPASTASIDGGTSNSGFTFYEQGYNFDAPDTGLPLAGVATASLDLPDYTFSFAPDYTASNGLLIDTNITSGALTFTNPAAFSSLSFLGASGNGDMTLDYTVHYNDGSNESGQLTVLDWFNGATAAFIANGRVGAIAGNFDTVGGGNPKLFTYDVALSTPGVPVQSVDFSRASSGDNSHAVLFAVSGSTGAEFSPIGVTGFNQDVIVEAGATHAGPVLASDDQPATTGTMDSAQVNTGGTWYEQGYALTAPLTGLPAAGELLTSQAASDHVYRMPASYSASNATIIDAANTFATLTPETPGTASALSFLASSGGGAVTIDYTLYHEDGSTTPGTLTVGDWFNGLPYAYTTKGRVSVQSGALDNVNAENPRLYSVDIPVANTSSPLTAIDLSYNSGNGHAAIMALSAAAGAVKPIFESQPASVIGFAGTELQLTANVSGTAPITFQFQKNVNGSYVNVANGNGISGATTSTLNFSNPALADGGGYILVASNPAGSSTSLVANVTVLSTALDISTAGDFVEGVGGTSPAAEPALNAVDDTTSKYLNFGTDGNTDAPFAGPVGVTITPSIGSTVLSGIRFYTANDATERDPADFLLEGSNDGETFTQIASGALNLPTARNAAGLTLDPLTQALQEINFSNTAGYTVYRVTFNNVRNNAAANSMQIGEIELLGVEGTGTPQTRLSIEKTGNNEVSITWDGPGTLESAPSVLGPWEPLEATSPATLPAAGNAQFFQVKIQ
jgi:hypothetical protein